MHADPGILQEERRGDLNNTASFIKGSKALLRTKKFSLRGMAPEYFLLLAPLAYLAWAAVLYAARGPNWIMVPQDLSYNYLLNALNVLNGDPIGSLIHPALTTIGYIAVVTWAAHLFFGSGPIETAVLADPEFYFLFSAHGTTLLTALCFYLMGRWAYQGLRSPSLVLMLQSFFFFPPPVSMVMNSYASPESLLVMLVMLQVGLTFRTLDGKLEDPSARKAYVIATAVIGSAAVATKFIALPILLLPFLVVPTWRSKMHYCLGLGFGIVVSLSPIALVREHRIQFIQDMRALSQSAISESQSRGVGDALASYAAQIRPIFDNFPVFIYGLILGLILLVALILYAPLMRTAIRNCPWALRLFIAAQATVVIAFVFMLARPKGHYLMPFVIFQGMGFTSFFMIAGRHLTLLRGSEPVRAQMIAMLVFATLSGAIFSHNVFFQNGLALLVNVRSAALQMHSYSFGAPGNNAIVTAIQASNIPTALYHGLQTSRTLHWESLATILPPNHYNYAYDGLHTYSHRHDAVSFLELQEMYDQIYFWTTRGNFKQHEWRQPIEAVWQDIRVADHERLSRLDALAIHERFDVRLTPEENAARGWAISTCRIGAACLEFSADPIDRKIVSHLRFLSDPDQFRAMPTRWQLEASADGRDWRTIESFVDHRPWTVLHDIDWPPNYKRVEEIKQNRVYRLNNDKFYLHYRLVFPQTPTDSKGLPGQVIAYATGGCAPDVRYLPVRTIFVGKEDSTLPGIDVITTGFWEETGTFPKVIMTDAAVSLVPRKYLLGTGNHGENGRDSWPRMPRSWVLEGSTNGKQWIVLDRQENVPQWQPNEVRSFRIKTKERFSQLRLVVNATTESGVVRIYKFRIEGDGLSSKQPVNRLSGRGVGLDGFYERLGPFPITLQSEFEQPFLLSSYRLTVGPHGKDSVDRMPKSWRLLGSQDGESWKLLDSRTAQSNWKNGELRIFEPAFKGHFRFLRLEVADVGGSEGIFRLSSIRYFTPRVTTAKQACSSSTSE